MLRGAPPVARLAIGACRNPLDRPPPADRILVVRLGALGDVVRTLPAVVDLRAAYPGAHIAWLVEPPAASALEDQPCVDEVIVFPRRPLARALRDLEIARAWRTWRAFAARLRERRFDLVLDFHALLRSALLARVSGAPCRVGYAAPVAREGAAWLATHRARLPARRISRFERNAALVEYLGHGDHAAAAAPWAVDPLLRARMEARLAPGRVPVALHPGSSDAAPHKRYDPVALAAVARGLRERNGVPSVVSAGPTAAEQSRARAVVEASDGAARLAPATPSLRELAALLASVRLCIAGDTGPLHLAALVGTPVVQLLGPTDPVENTPWPGTPWRRVHVPLACSPCRRGCPATTCMRRIEPRAVVAAAGELLGAAAPAPAPVRRAS